MEEQKNLIPEPPNLLLLNTPAPKKPITFYILGLILVALISGGIVYFWQKNTSNKNQTPSIESNLNENISQKPTPTPTVNPTLNWVIFKEDYKENPQSPTQFIYEFKYPSDWQTEGRPNSRDNFWYIPGKEEPNNVMKLSISDSAGKSVEDWIKRDQFPYEIEKRFKTDYIEGVIVSDPVTIGNSLDIAFFKVKDKIFSLGISSFPPKLDINPVILLEQILLTFQFK